jgi:RHS repeat-associated protein
MDPSVFGTGSIVLNKAQAALNIAGAGSNTVPGYSNGGFVTQNGFGRVDPIARALQLNWALPTGRPADFPMVLNYQSNTGLGTEFGYNIQGPDGRITSLTVNGNQDLVRLVTPELCTTSLIYDGNHHLLAWVDPLGFRFSYVYDSGTSSSVSASVQPLGQRTTYLSFGTTIFHGPSSVVVYPTLARTTMTVTPLGGPPISILNPVGNRTSYAYTFSGGNKGNSLGYLSRVEDARGHITTISYQSAAAGTTAIFPTAIQNAIASYQYRYNSNNQLAAVIDELGNRSSLVWDSSGNRTAVVDPYNQRTTYVYDSMARLIAVENALGFRATQLYDSIGRLAADINPLGFRTSYAYDANSQLLHVQDPLGHITTTLHDNVNRLTVQIDPMGNRTSFTYDVDSRLIRTTNPIGAITTQIFDANSRLVAMVDALGLRTSYAYDISSNLIRSINPLGQINTTVYDLANRPVAQIDALGNRTSFAYDASWNLIRTVNPLGFITTGVFDSVNRRVASVDALLNRTSMTYDLADDPIRTTNPLGFSTTSVFDKLLRPVATVDPLLNRMTTMFDVASRRIRVQDANRSITTTIYDKASRATGLLNANGFRTTQVFDAASRLVALVDANTHRNSFVYDADSRQTQLVDPLGRRTTYAFDAASRKTLRIDARGFRTSYTYDFDNRLLGQHYPDSSRVTFVYDNASRRTLLSDWTGRYTSTYDADGRLSVVVNPAGLCLTYAYDAASQRKYLIEPEGARFTYTFDADGRTNYVANPQGQRATWSYDAASRVTGIHYANTTRTSYLYDNASRLLRVANLSSTSTTLSSFSYALDGVGNRLRVVESSGNRVTWSYDKTYQLRNEQRSGSNSYNITYTYDPVGNRLVLINGGVPTTSTYDVANELHTSHAFSVGITTYTSDAAGNLLTSVSPSNQRTTNTWDFENRLTQAALPSAIVDTFTYNGDGQRVQKIDSTGTTRHVWDGQNILLETNASNIIQVVYTLQPQLYGNLISQWRGGIASFYLFDGLGSTTQLANSIGTVTDSYLYDSFGNILLTSGSSTNWFRYSGRQGYYYDDDTGDNYVRARSYSPLAGRFLCRDRMPDEFGLFGYRYVYNNPVNLTDPSGLIAGYGSASWRYGCFTPLFSRAYGSCSCVGSGISDVALLTLMVAYMGVCCQKSALRATVYCPSTIYQVWEMVSCLEQLLNIQAPGKINCVCD